MKLLVIGSTVDDGTSSITRAFIEALQPDHFIEISHPIKGAKIGDFLKWRSLIRSEAKIATHIICLHHTAIMLGGLFLPIKQYISLTGMTNWTPAFPSRRTDSKTNRHMWLYMRLLRRFDKIFAPPPDLRDFFWNHLNFRMEKICLPPPYGDVDFAPLSIESDQIRMLFIGKDFKRKGGEVLLKLWRENSPRSASLTLVNGDIHPDLPERVVQIANLKAGTSLHRKTLSEHHLFVLPSFREAYGFAALEALNFGLVVAVTRNAGIASIVEESGGIVEDTPEQVVEAALELAGNPAEILNRQEKAREFARKYRARFRVDLERMTMGKASYDEKPYEPEP
jgi:glycosyltransferase involved in cell wall biosynthesis